MKYIVITTFYVAFLLTSGSAWAQSKAIELPTEELARDTALPVFDVTKVIRNRYVKTKGRFEVSGGIGFNMTEALYNEMSFNVGAGYNFTETHGVNVFAFLFQDGLSSNGEDLKNGKGLGATVKFDAELAPSPETAILADYQFTAWYGKVSVTKKSVMNLSLYGLLGVNSVDFGDSNSFGLHLGFGQKFYMGKSFAIRYDLRALMYKGPDPASDTQTTNPLNGGAVRTSDQLADVSYLPFIFNLGLSYVF